MSGTRGEEEVGEDTFIQKDAFEALRLRRT